MKIRAYQDEDNEALVALWQRVFLDDPPHNDPSQVITAKQAVDELIFIALEDGPIVGAVMAGYDDHPDWLYAAAVDHSMPTRNRSEPYTRLGRFASNGMHQS